MSDVKRAQRAKALATHPDKSTDPAAAAKDFHELQQHYEHLKAAMQSSDYGPKVDAAEFVVPPEEKCYQSIDGSFPFAARCFLTTRQAS